jgi:hypothetical protein
VRLLTYFSRVIVSRVIVSRMFSRRSLSSLVSRVLTMVGEKFLQRHIKAQHRRGILGTRRAGDANHGDRPVQHSLVAGADEKQGEVGHASLMEGFCESGRHTGVIWKPETSVTSPSSHILHRFRPAVLQCKGRDTIDQPRPPLPLPPLHSHDAPHWRQRMRHGRRHGSSEC